MYAPMLNIALGTYLGAAGFGGLHLAVPQRLFRTMFGLTISAAVFLTATALAVRWVDAERAPWSTMHETLVLSACLVGLVYVLLGRGREESPAGFLAALFGVLLLAFASFSDSTVRPLVPALRSNWLIIHVLFCFVGYAAFAVAFLTSILYLVQRRPSLDEFSFRAISIGFVGLNVGILCGAVWANQAWGHYWSWDPKETWALVTWLIYGIYLHGRRLRGWSPKALSWLSIVGFAATVFTYVGVNYLIVGLHSYVK